MRKIFIILAAGLLSLSAGAQTSEALPFIQMDFNPASIAMGSSKIPSAAVLPLSGIRLAGGVAYESYMPKLSSTKYISDNGQCGHRGCAYRFSGARSQC